MKLTLAAKSLTHKFSIVASVLLGSCSVGYYYLVYLPQRDVQFEPQRVLESFRAAAEKRLSVLSRNCRCSNKTYRSNERRNKKWQKSDKPWRRPTAIERV